MIGRFTIAVSLAFAAGSWMGMDYGAEALRVDQRISRRHAMELCSARKGLGTYWVLKRSEIWHCFYEQPSWPHRIKRGVLIGVEPDVQD